MMRINYQNIELPTDVLDAFSKFLTPHIRAFYQSDEGKAYFENWLKKHPEYADKQSAHSTRKGESL